MAHAQAQCDMGPRPPGSQAHDELVDYISNEMRDLGWVVERDDFTYEGVVLSNVSARRGAGPILMVGAHYDTRRVADMDPDPTVRNTPIVGANDGASGVAVLLELARALSVDSVGHQVQLVYFDAEDQGGAAGWEWFVGSTRVAEAAAALPRGAFSGLVLVDMIGDLDQRVCRAADSTPSLADPIFASAGRLGYEAWLPAECRYRVLDDHTPFLERGLAAVDLIDFDYHYWHTQADTCDKIGAPQLERVGRTLELWLEEGAPGARIAGGASSATASAAKRRTLAIREVDRGER